MAPIEVADHVFRGIGEDRFLILTHPELNDLIQKRLDRILNDGIPLPEYTRMEMPERMGQLVALLSREAASMNPDS